MVNPASVSAASDTVDPIDSTSTMSQAMPHAHNYHAWVFESFARHLVPGSALEIGSGHGAYSRKLAERASEVIVSDIDPAAIERIRAELGDVANVRYLVMNGLDPEGRRALGAPVDNVVLLNLLEHIERDAALLASCRDCLRPGGVLVVFSPAFPALYSRMDREAGHFRRYRKGELVSLVERSGFELIEARHFNAVGFFGWYANKLLQSGIHSGSTNAQIGLFDRLVPLFKRVDRLLPLIGQSVVVTARKRG